IDRSRPFPGKQVVGRSQDRADAIDVQIGIDAKPGLEHRIAEMVGKDAWRALTLVKDQPVFGQDLSRIAPLGARWEPIGALIGIDDNIVTLAQEGADAQYFEPAQRAVPETDNGGQGHDALAYRLCASSMAGCPGKP